MNTYEATKNAKCDLKQREVIALDMARFCKIAQLTFNIQLPSRLHYQKNQILQEKSSINICDNEYRYPLSDPRVALWMLQHGEDENTMEHLLYTYYYPENLKTKTRGKSTYRQHNGIMESLLQNEDNRVNKKSLGTAYCSVKCCSLSMHPKNSTTSSQSSKQSMAEALLCVTTMPRIEIDLRATKLFETYHQVEMPCLSVLVKR